MSDQEPVAATDDLASDAMPAVAVHSAEPAGARLAPLLATSALALAVLAGVELLLTIVLGLAVDVDRLSRVARIGYAFLTQMEKSPLGVLLVLAALGAACAAKLAPSGSRADNRAALTAGLVLGFAIVLAIGSILAVVARFNVADLAASQKIDGVTRRVLAIFVVRNVGAAAAAFAIASTAVRPRPRA